MGRQIRWSEKAGKALIIFFAAIGIASCCASKKLPTHTETVTIYNKVDSIAYHDSTIYHTLYKEYYKDYADLLDTLRLETSYSEFESYIDTTAKVLKGSATNKIKDVAVKIKWKEKIVYRDSIITKTKEIPVEVPVEVTKYPKSYWWFLGFTVLALIYVILKLILRFKYNIKI